MAAHLYLRAPGEKGRPPRGMDAVIHLDETGVKGYPLHHNLAHLYRHHSHSGSEAGAFLLAALGVWAGDKLLPRKAALDAWTREIVLHLPATGAWVGLASRLARLLNFLTGDEWTLKSREARVDLGQADLWPHPWQPQAVALFSGGLDSLAGAIDLLEEGRRVLLVSHYDFHHF
jgi:hypothetical protein